MVKGRFVAETSSRHRGKFVGKFVICFIFALFMYLLWGLCLGLSLSWKKRYSLQQWNKILPLRAYSPLTIIFTQFQLTCSTLIGKRKSKHKFVLKTSSMVKLKLEMEEITFQNLSKITSFS